MAMSQPDQDTKAFRQALCEERDALQQSSAGTAEKRSPVTLDQQSVGRLSRMDAMQGQAWLLPRRNGASKSCD